MASALCWTRPLGWGEDAEAAAAAAATATTDWRGVEASEGTRRGAGEEEEETAIDDADALAIERRLCWASGAAAPGATLPGDGKEPAAAFARRGVGLSLRAILDAGKRREREKKEKSNGSESVRDKNGILKKGGKRQAKKKLQNKTKTMSFSSSFQRLPPLPPRPPLRLFPPPPSLPPPPPGDGERFLLLASSTSRRSLAGRATSTTTLRRGCCCCCCCWLSGRPPRGDLDLDLERDLERERLSGGGGPFFPPSSPPAPLRFCSGGGGPEPLQSLAR